MLSGSMQLVLPRRVGNAPNIRVMVCMQMPKGHL